MLIRHKIAPPADFRQDNFCASVRNLNLTGRFRGSSSWPSYRPWQIGLSVHAQQAKRITICVRGLITSVTITRIFIQRALPEAGPVIQACGEVDSSHLRQTTDDYKNRLGSVASPLRSYTRAVNPVMNARTAPLARWVFPPIAPPLSYHVFREETPAKSLNTPVLSGAVDGRDDLFMDLARRGNGLPHR